MASRSCREPWLAFWAVPYGISSAPVKCFSIKNIETILNTGVIDEHIQSWEFRNSPYRKLDALRFRRHIADAGFQARIFFCRIVQNFFSTAANNDIIS